MTERVAQIHTTKSHDYIAVDTHLQQKKYSFQDHEVHFLDREDSWFERGIKEAMYVKVEWPSLNRGGGRPTRLC